MLEVRVEGFSELDFNKAGGVSEVGVVRSKIGF